MAFISFVFSFYNEEQTLPLLINRIREEMTKERDDFEMIFVNDASRDNSVQAIQREKNKGKGEIVIVDMSRRFGVEECFLAGIEAARGDAIILMYTDMQDPPEVMHQMLQQWREGAEVVHCVRRKRIGDHPLKVLAAHIAYRLIGRLSDIKIPYDAGEFKLISKNVAHHLLSLPEVEPYLRGLIPWIGFKQAFVEYDMQPRTVGRSKIPLFGKKAWTVFLSGIVSFSDSPIYFILLTGLVGVGLFLMLMILSIVGGTAAFGFQNLFLLFVWSTLMLALGILGVYILRIYKNTRGRPRYIIKEIIRS